MKQNITEMITPAKIKAISSRIGQNIIEIRRHLHRHPELSFCEHETSSFVISCLDEIGISWQRMATTGIVGLIKGQIPSNRVVALRADMDALPITESNNHLPYASINPGIMHACGHDAHTASLIGTAMILYEIKEKFSGTIKLIFQPAEEKLPGGAKMMIQEGVFENPVPEVIIGQHVMPQLECGKIGLRPGKYMASQDEIYLTVKGKGGHGAQPNQNIDPVLIASHLIVSLQQIVSRIADPKFPSVLSFGRVIANGSTNIIPDEVYIEGTFRTMNETWRTVAHAKIKKMAIGIAEAMGGICEVNIIRGYPFLINEERLTARVRNFAEEFIGKDNIVTVDTWMASEDFAYYSQVKDACFYRLGTGNSKRGITSSLHTSTFDIDEGSLEQGAGLMAFIALSYLAVKDQ